MSLSALAFLLSAFLAVAPTARPQQELVRFEIKDQFGTVYTDEAYREGIFVLVGSDRGGSAFSAEWSKAIRDSLDTLPEAVTVHMAGLAHMNAVPRLLRGFVKSQFPQRPEAWVLLDWKGVFEEAYGYEKDNTTVLVFIDGVLTHRTHGRAVEPSKIEALRSAVEQAVAPTEPAEAYAAANSSPR